MEAGNAGTLHPCNLPSTGLVDVELAILQGFVLGEVDPGLGLEVDPLICTAPSTILHGISRA